jgi:alpha,alpha-trehalose phosphorylase
VDGKSLTIRHHGETVTVEPDQTVELAIPPVEARPVPRQPPGRVPAKRRPLPGAQAFDPGTGG